MPGLGKLIVAKQGPRTFRNPQTGEPIKIPAKRVCKFRLAKQMKDEIYQCPPILVLVGRPQDAWLATWSRADAAVPHPIDPIQLAEAVTRLVKSRVAVSS